MTDNEKHFLTLIIFSVLTIIGLACVGDILSESRRFECFKSTQNVECLRSK